MHVQEVHFLMIGSIEAGDHYHHTRKCTKEMEMVRRRGYLHFSQDEFDTSTSRSNAG